MAYFSKGHNMDDDGDDFDEYDPTPYGGGYDIHLTYGHPLPASEEICHPPSQNYSDDEAVEYTSYADVSGYDNDDAVENEYSSYTRYGSARKNQDVEEEQQEVVDEYDAERTEFEEPSYERSEELEQESEAYGRYEEDEYGGRRKYGADNDGYEDNEEKEDHRRTYYDD